MAWNLQINLLVKYFGLFVGLSLTKSSRNPGVQGISSLLPPLSLSLSLLGESYIQIQMPSYNRCQTAAFHVADLVITMFTSEVQAHD